MILPILAYYGTGRLWDYHWKKQTDIFGTNTRTTGRIKLTGVAVLPPAIQDVLNFEGHALEQMGKRKISLVQANDIAENAILAIRQRNGAQHSYYSDKGFIVIRQDGSIGTVGWLDDGGKKLMEVVKKHGIPH